MNKPTPSSNDRRQPSPLAELFKKRRNELQLTQEQLVERVNKLLPQGQALTQQTYGAFEIGRSQSSKYAAVIAKAMDIPLDRLASPDDQRYTYPKDTVCKTSEVRDAPAVGAVDVWDDDTPLDEDEVEVPFLREVELSAGTGRTVIQEASDLKLRFGRRSLRKHGVQPENAVCVPIHGNSMEPILRHGATVGVDRGRCDLHQIVDGDLYAIDHAGQLRVKQLYRLPAGGLRLRSFNRDEHPDEEYSLSDLQDQGIRILGRVFWGAMFF